MKKKKLFAALTACAVSAAMLPAVNAFAALPYYWGTVKAEDYANMTVLDDCGMFEWLAEGEALGKNRPYLTCTEHFATDRDDDGDGVPEHQEWDTLAVLFPRVNTLTFTLEGGLDTEEAAQKILPVLRKYYPDLNDLYHNPAPYQHWSEEPVHKSYLTMNDFYSDDISFVLTDLDETAGDPETAGKIMHDLAAQGLISAFYSWGQTADYIVPVGYMYQNGKYIFEYEFFDRGPVSPAEVQAYLAENAAGCTFEQVEDTGAGYWPAYRLYCREDMDFAAAFEVTAQMKKTLGIAPTFLILESAEAPKLGQNLLTQSGDLNIDGKVSIADAILLARYLAEDRTVSMLPAGRQNAELDGDGLLTAADLASLLRLIAGIG